MNITVHKPDSKKADKSLKNSGPILSLVRRFGRFLYSLCYTTGERTEICAAGILEFLKKTFNTATEELFCKSGDFARRLYEIKRSKVGRGEVSLTRSIMIFGFGIHDTVKICTEAFKSEGIGGGLIVAGKFVSRSCKRFFGERRRVFNYLAPAAAVFVLAMTIFFWSNSTFALKVNYGGTELGIVNSEETFRSALKEVEMNVSDASGKNFKLDDKVTYKMTLAKKSDVSDVDQIYNNIVMKSLKGVKNGYGLYIDNRLAGACTENGAIEAMLNKMTSSYKKDADVQSVGFTQNVSVKAGLFPENVFKSAGEIKEIVTGENSSTGEVSTLRQSGIFRISLDPLYAMNLSTDGNADNSSAIVAVTSQPKLSVKVVKTEQYTKSIDYTTTKKDSDKIKKGTTKVNVKGQNGEEKVIAEVTYLDGKKVGEKVLECKVTKEAVNEEILVGTKKKTSRYNVDTGSFGDAGGGDYSVVSTARSALGVGYVSCGESFSGFDCSGLTKYVYSKYGISLPHSAAAQSAYGSYVSKSALKAGDLVFFDTNGGRNNITHVGIYVGGGQFINASTSWPRCVRVDSINSAYYSSKYVTARRVK